MYIIPTVRSTPIPVPIAPAIVASAARSPTNMLPSTVIVGMYLLRTFSTILGWWPLNGNANDYSGYGNDGTAANVTYTSAWTNGYSAP